MPRGVYDRSAARAARTEKFANIKVNYDSQPHETDDQIDTRISERFEILDVLTEACTVGNARALIVSGAPGVGKSFGVEKILKEYDPSESIFTIVKGYTRATGVVKLLYQYRHPGNVIVFDDADSALQDDIALNLIKSVADTTEKRYVSWLSEGKLIDDETAEIIPRKFLFEGSVIFLTNLDFEQLVARGHKLAPHLEALMSRSYYLDLSMRSRRDYLVRIKQVVKQGMLNFLNGVEKHEVVSFIENNFNNMRELSLRSCIKLGNLRKNNKNWEKISRITMLKM
jgi:hypothetical protein